MPQVTTVGIDLAKNVVCIHGVDTHGHVVVKKRLARQKVLPFVAQLPPCLMPPPGRVIPYTAWRPLLRQAPATAGPTAGGGRRVRGTGHGPDGDLPGTRRAGARFTQFLPHADDWPGGGPYLPRA